MALANPQEVFFDAVSSALKPDPKLSVSNWANENIYLPQTDSSEPGKYRVERTPYLRAILDELGSNSRSQIITLMKGAQIGATTVGNIWLAFIIEHQPGPCLYVLPTLDTAKRTSKQRIQPMFDACPALEGLIADHKSKEASNSIMLKEFKGGILIFAGSNSAAGLRSMPARYLMLDELSAYEADIDDEGDPVELAKRRTATFKRHRKIFQPSTPTIKGLDRVEMEFEKSDKRFYHVPCPHCYDKAPITWKRVQWDKEKLEDGTEKHLPLTAHIICENCGCRIDEKHKTWMMDEANGAEWIATAKGEPFHVGFHINSLYSPVGWYSWSDAVSEFLAAKEKADQGDITLLKTWTNTVLGETWASKGTEIAPHHIWRRRENYPTDCEVPAEVLYVTAGVDVQIDRMEISVYGFGLGEECWAIEHRVIWGDPSDRTDPIYDKLDEVLFNTKYKHEQGHNISIGCTGIDTGFLATQLYDYIKTRQRQGVFAVKGDKGLEGIPIISTAKHRKTGRDKRPVKLFNIGTFETKRLIYGRLMLKNKGPGYIHYPIMEDYDAEFFDQLTAERIEEKLVKGFRKRYFVKKRPRNEALDCFVYAIGALHIANPRFENLGAYYEEHIEKETHSKEPQVNKKVINKNTRPRSRRGAPGFINSWK